MANIDVRLGVQYAGKRGKDRIVTRVDGGEIFYRRAGEEVVRNCWISTFKAWAVKEVGEV